MGFLKNLIVVELVVLSSTITYAQTQYDYERSALHVMLLHRLSQKYDKEVQDVFHQMPFPSRFYDHNLGVNVFSVSKSDENMTQNIQSFIEQVNLGQKMVSKWFNRDKQTGSMNVNLVLERGLYNATFSDVQVVNASFRGKVLLMDAGAQLIHNTYLLVHDIQYNTLAGVGGGLFNMQGVGGFCVTVTSYLYRLRWDDEIAGAFYKMYYTEDGLNNPDKVQGYLAEKNLFKMDFAGMISTTESERKVVANVKNPTDMLTWICTRAADKNIAKLQREYPDFRIKAPLESIEPLTAHVGLKEDVSVNTRYEVLIRSVDKQGIATYERQGIIRPVEGKIWDNRFNLSDRTTDDNGLSYTTFETVSGGPFYPGMLIQEILK